MSSVVKAATLRTGGKILIPCQDLAALSTQLSVFSTHPCHLAEDNRSVQK